MGSVHDFIDRIFTTPGENARGEAEQRAQGEANAAMERQRSHEAMLNAHRQELERKHAGEIAQQQEMLGRQQRRSMRGRIKGGLFGDVSQPPSMLSGRLGK
jgi:hypothetical protein